MGNSEKRVSIASSLKYGGALHEKLVIAKRMFQAYYKLGEIDCFVAIPLEMEKLAFLDEEEAFEQYIQDTEKIIHENLFKNKITDAFLKLADDDQPKQDEMKQKIHQVYEEIVEKGRREAKMRVAYRMINDKSFINSISISNIADITGLEASEVDRLYELWLTRNVARQDILKKVAKNGQEKGLDQHLLARLTGLSVAELSCLQNLHEKPDTAYDKDMIWMYDEGEQLYDDTMQMDDEDLDYDFEFSFL